MINASLPTHLAQSPSTSSPGTRAMRLGMHFSPPPNSISHSWGDSAASNWTGLRGQPVYKPAKFKAGFMNLERDFHAVCTTVKLSADSI